MLRSSREESGVWALPVCFFPNLLDYSQSAEVWLYGLLV